jgi:hypothetical protein
MSLPFLSRSRPWGVQPIPVGAALHALADRDESRKIHPRLWTAAPSWQISPHRHRRDEDSGENDHRWSNLGPICREPTASGAN